MKALKTAAGCVLIVWAVGVGMYVYRSIVLKPDYYAHSTEFFVAVVIGLLFILGGLYMLKGVFRDN